MFKINKVIIMLLTVGILGCTCAPASAAVRIEGQVQAGGGGIANSSVTLWAASAGEPRQLAQARTNADGRFELTSQETPGPNMTLYVIARGGEASINKGSGENPETAFLAVLGNAPPDNMVINEMTTVASVWTTNQFIDGTIIKGHPLGLKIAAGNVPNFVNLQTAAGARPFRMRSIARRQPQWRTLPRSPACWPLAPHALGPTPAQACSPRQRRPEARRQLIRSPHCSPLHAIRRIDRRDSLRC